eukprot:1161681-Pelagomonas_calceolata.AAC.7
MHALDNSVKGAVLPWTSSPTQCASPLQCCLGYSMMLAGAESLPLVLLPQTCNNGGWSEKPVPCSLYLTNCFIGSNML